MTWAILGVIVTLSFVTEAMIGFGSTVLTVTLGAHLLPLDVLLPAFIPINLVLSLVIVARDRRAVDLRLMARKILPLVGAGTLFGMFLFRAADPRAMKLTLALFIVVLAATELLRLRRQSRAPAASESALPRPVAALLLLAGGVAHGLFGSGGPLVVYVSSHELADKSRFRATLSAVWIVLNSALIVNYAWMGQLGASSSLRSLAILPALLVAIPLGEWLHHRVSARLFRPLVYVVLLFAGAALGIRSLGS